MQVRIAAIGVTRRAAQLGAKYEKSDGERVILANLPECVCRECFRFRTVCVRFLLLTERGERSREQQEDLGVTFASGNERLCNGEDASPFPAVHGDLGESGLVRVGRFDRRGRQRWLLSSYRIDLSRRGPHVRVVGVNPYRTFEEAARGLQVAYLKSSVARNEQRVDAIGLDVERKLRRGE